MSGGTTLERQQHSFRAQMDPGIPAQAPAGTKTRTGAGADAGS